MTTNSNEQPIVLAIHPTTMGYSFAYLEGPDHPIDWGNRDIQGEKQRRNERSLDDIERLLTRYIPEVLVLEDWSEVESKRADRIRALYTKVEWAAQARGIKVERISKEDVLEAFNARTRHEVAEAVVKRFPAFLHRLPPERRAWDKERRAMGMFSALALALDYYAGLDGDRS